MNRQFSLVDPSAFHRQECEQLIQKGIYPTVKRAIDLIGSIVALALLSPLFVLAAIAVKVDSRGPVFFRQTRIGRGGQPFKIIKFRTMKVQQPAGGPQVTSAVDKRMTRAGRIMRKMKIDEIPQLINVLLGQMSFVGPRPQVPRYVDRFPESLKPIILSAKPGITSPATILFRFEEKILANKPNVEEYYIQKVVPVKSLIDAEYVLAMSPRLDMMTLIQTFWLMFIGFVNCFLPRNRRIVSGVPFIAPSEHDELSLTDEMVRKVVGPRTVPIDSLMS